MGVRNALTFLVQFPSPGRFSTKTHPGPPSQTYFLPLPSAQKEKARLLAEIERLMEESGEIEEAYSSAVSDKEELATQLEELRAVVSSLEGDRENADNKLAKVSENLKKVSSLFCFVFFARKNRTRQHFFKNRWRKGQ
jgi:hypothetical protein